jgi:creatinine amidohydrolase
MKARSRPAEHLPVQWEELTASDFPGAVKRAEGVCVLPIGVVEKHGPHLPLGTDVMAARAAAIGAAEREYVVVFPHYYFGQIYEARHQPGCVTIPPELMNPLLQGVCDCIGRNGFEKILIVNGHGGNNDWLPFFCQTQLSHPRNHVVYIARPGPDPRLGAKIKALRRTDWGGHACEFETSRMMAIRPDLVQLDRAGRESGRPLRRLERLPAFTAMFWYADFPNHFAGDPAASNPALGQLELEADIRGLVKVYRAVKRDEVARKLQDEFFARSGQPLKTTRRKSPR